MTFFVIVLPVIKWSKVWWLMIIRLLLIGQLRKKLMDDRWSHQDETWLSIMSH